MYVVVQFYTWLKFYFRLFWGMLMYGNEFNRRPVSSVGRAPVC